MLPGFLFKILLEGLRVFKDGPFDKFLLIRHRVWFVIGRKRNVKIGDTLNVSIVLLEAFWRVFILQLYKLLLVLHYATICVVVDVFQNIEFVLLVLHLVLSYDGIVNVCKFVVLP